MQREIKFKAYWKDESSGEVAADTMVIRIGERSYSAGSQQSNFRDLIGFCHCTGLKDKNGKEIYEGDILKLDETPEILKGTEFHNHEDISHHHIYWDTERAMFWDKRLEDGDSLSAHLDGDISFVSDCQIVGNIYQSTHLLK